MSERLNTTFTDRNGQPWRLEIHDAQYVGTPATFTGTRGGFQLEWSSPADETHPSILPSTLRLEVVRTSPAVDAFLAAIPAREEGEMVAKLYKGTALEWLGLVLPESLEIEADDLNGLATFEAVDDLGMLSRQPYRQSNGEAFTGWDRITSHLLKVLNKTRTAQHMTPTELGGADFLRVIDHVTPQTAEGTPPPNRATFRTRVDHSAFYEVEDGNTAFMTCADVLEQLAQLFGARVFFAAGAWNFAPPFAYMESNPPSFYGFQQDGSAGTSSGTLPSPLDLTTTGATEVGWATIYHPPFRAVYREQRYAGNLPSYGPHTATSAAGEWGPTLASTLGHVYQVGSTFTVSGTLRVVLQEDATLTGSDRVVRWLFGVQLVATGEEVGGTRYYVAQPPAPATPYDLESVTWYNASGPQTAPIFNPTPTPVGSWTATPGGDRWACWTPAQVAADTPGGGSVLLFPFSFTTTETVTTAANVGVVLSLEGWTGHYADGSNNTATNSQSAAYLAQALTYEVQDLTITLGEQGANNGNALRFGALLDPTTTLVENMELPPALVGDKVTDNSSGRTQLETQTSGGWQDSAAWTSHLTTTPGPINSVLCRDRIQLRGHVLHSLTGQVHEAPHFTPLQAVTDDGRLYLVTTCTRVLDIATTGLTCTLLEVVGTAIGSEDDGTTVPGPGFPGGGTTDPTTTDPNGQAALGAVIVQAAQPAGGVLNLPSDAVDDSNSLQKFATAGELATIASNKAAITATSSVVALMEKVLKYTTGGGGYGIYSDEGKGTASSFVGITETGSKMQAGALTELLLTESSPGTAVLQVAAGPAGSEQRVAAISVQGSATTAKAQVTISQELNASGPVTFTDLVDLTSATVNGLSTADLSDVTSAGSGAIITTAERSKLEGIEAGAQVNAVTSVNGETGAVVVEGFSETVKNVSATTLLKGTPVHVTGSTGNEAEVVAADMASHFPAQFILAQDLAPEAVGQGVAAGFINNVNVPDASAFSPGQEVWLDTAGGWATTRPAGDEVQRLGLILKVNTSTDKVSGIIYALGHTIEAGGGGIQEGEDVTLGALTVDSLTTTGNVQAAGAFIGATGLLATGNIQTTGQVSAASATLGSTTATTLTVTSTFQAGALEFIGGGTSTIGPASSGSPLPSDLEIRSNGNVVVQLDADDNESGQAFQIKSSTGVVLFAIDENGQSSGLLTSPAPTFTAQASYQQGAVASVTVTNHQDGTTYTATIYDSAGAEVTSNPVSQSGADLTFTAPATIATGYELRVRAAKVGQLMSAETVATFEVIASRTFTHWRFEVRHNGGTERSRYLMALNLDLYEGAQATGTKHPSAALTSPTSLAGLTLTWGYQYPGREFWKIFDANETGTDWWTISSPNPGDQQWGQLEFSTAITVQSIRLTYNGQFTTANQLRVLGSNTGSFSGEEIECGTFALTTSTAGTFVEILNI